MCKHFAVFHSWDLSMPKVFCYLLHSFVACHRGAWKLDHWSGPANTEIAEPHSSFHMMVAGLLWKIQSCGLYGDKNVSVLINIDNLYLY